MKQTTTKIIHPITVNILNKCKIFYMPVLPTWMKRVKKKHLQKNKLDKEVFLK